LNRKSLTGIWQKVYFSYEKKKIVPKGSGIYLLTNFSGDILYIGISINLQRRFNEHLSSVKSFEMTPKGRSFWFYYSLCEEKKHRSLERGLLGQVELTEGCLPWFNRVSPPT